MKGKMALTVILIGFIIILVGATPQLREFNHLLISKWLQVTGPSKLTGLVTVDNDQMVGGTITIAEGAVIKIPVRNKSGGTLTANDVVIWDTTSIVNVDSTVRVAAVDTIPTADTMALEGGYYLTRTYTSSLANACTVWIIGTTDGSDTRDTIIHTASGLKYSEKYWATISSIIMHGWDANDSIRIASLPVYYNEANPAAVTTTTTAAHALVAGVISATVVDNAVGEIVVYGIQTTKVNCASTEGLLGMYVETINAAKKARPNATPAAGKALGVLLQAGNTDGTYDVFINTIH